MKFKKKLKYGETPFDDLSREDLLLLVKRNYSALTAAESLICQFRHNDPNSLFWGTTGTGGRTLAKVEFCLKPFAGYTESIWRSFFRLADYLLFEGAPGTGDPWVICKCGQLLGSGRGEQPPKDRKCFSCDRPMRPLEWKDLQPIPE